MAIDTNIQEFTDAEMLVFCRKAIADILIAGQAFSQNGRQLTRADLPELRETIEWLEERINADDTDTAGGLALVQYGERV